MSLSENVKNLIRSVAENNIQKARSYAKIIVSNETAASNQYFCKMIKNKIETQPNFIELPFDIRGILRMEDVSDTFNENRYYLTKREKEMQAKIKELEAKLEFKKYGDLDEIEFEEYMSHFIPKQKVKDKIEKLKKDYDKKYDLFMGHKFQSKEQQDILKQMRILKELLEEGE